MASEGLILDISNEFLENLKKADKAIEKIANVSDTSKQRIIQMFQDIDKHGISHVIDKTNEMKRGFELLANANIEVKGFKKIQSDAKNAIDEINKLVSSLNNMQMGKQDKLSYNRYESTQNIENIDRRIQAEKDMASIRTRNHDKYQRELEEMFRREDANDKARYDTWLARKHHEAKEHKRIEDEKYNATVQSIDKQNAKIAEAENRRQQNQQVKNNSQQVKQAYEEQLRMYSRMFDEIERREQKYSSERDARNQKQKQDKLKQLSDEIKAYQEYQERIKRLEQQRIAQQSRNRADKYAYTQRYGDTSNQAIAAYNRLYSVNSVRSVQQMNKVISQMQQAQQKLNLNTEDGKKRYDELGAKIRRVQRDLNQATGASEEFKQSQQSLSGVAGQLGRQLAAVFSVQQIVNYAKQVVNVRKEFELQHKSLQIILQDQDEANKLWQQTVDLALKSPFRVKELVTYTKQLAAYRIETGKLHDTTKMLADVSAGLGVDMQRLILAYGQVRAAEFLRGTELRQFTEAGVPMLDELARYFTEIEGKAVSTAEVFARISKRQVLFADVEEVLKRMTGVTDGVEGVFYKMQERQAQTLHGMISNLHDSIDLMMNDIGQANDSMMKDMVSLAKTVVDNWRMIGSAIQQVGISMAVMGIVNFAKGWRAVATGVELANTQMRGMTLLGAKVNLVLKQISKTLIAHPWFALGAAVLSASKFLYDHNKAVEAANKKYDEQANTIVRSMDKLNKYKKTVEENNKVIKNSKSAEQDVKEARGENINILSELQKLYPENFKNITLEKDGTIKLTEAINTQNEALEEQIILKELAKGEAFNPLKGQAGLEDFSKNYSDVEEEYTKRSIAIDKVKESMASFKRELIELEEKGMPQDVYELFLSKAEAVQVAENYNDIIEALNDLQKTLKPYEGVGSLYVYSNAFTNLVKQDEEYERRLKTLYQNTDKYLDYTKTRIINFSTDIEKSNWLNNLLIQIGTANDEIRKRVGEDMATKSGFVFTMPDTGEGEDENERKRKQLEAENEQKRIISQRIKMIRDMAKAYEDLNDTFTNIEAQTRVIDSYSDAFADLFNGIMDIEDVDFTTPQGVVDALRVLEESGKLTASQLRDVKKAIAEVSTEIDVKGAKSEADAMLQSIEDMFGQYEISLELQKLDIPQGFAKELFDIDVTSLAEIRKKVQDEISKIELAGGGEEDKLKKLKEYERKVAEMETKEQQERLKTYLKYTRDAIGERAKVKLEELHKLEEIEKTFVAKVGETPEEAAERERAKQLAIQGVRREANEELQKLDWEALKSSDMFVDMFGDLENVSRQALDAMISQLETYKDQWADLPVDQMKEIAKQLEKMRNASAEKEALESPFSYFKNNKRISQQEIQDAEETIISGQSEILGYDNQIAKLEIINNLISEKKDATDLINQYNAEYGTTLTANTKNLQEQKTTLVDNKNTVQKTVDAQRDVLTEAQKQNKVLEAQSKYLGDDLKMAQDLYDAFKGLYEALGGDEDSPVAIFADMGMSMTETVIQTIQLQIQLDIARQSAEGLGVAMNSAMGVVGWIVMGVQLLTKAISAIVKVHDDKLQRQIELEQENVEELTKKYENLSKSINEAYNLSQLEQYAAESRKYTEDMIDSYEQMIALEEAKKRTDEDKINEYNDAILDAQEEIADRQKELFSEVTDGILDSPKDAATEFVDAWLESFKEVGDGLQGLEEASNEMIANIIKKQIALSIVTPYLNDWQKKLKEYIDPEKGDLTLSIDEANDFADKVKHDLPYLSESLQNAFGSVSNLVDIFGDGGELAGLQKGIEGITEVQAEEITAYLNSLRFYVAQESEALINLANKVLSTDETVNPMLAQLRIIASQTTAINELLNSLTSGGHSMGGRGFRVFIS